MTITTTPSSSNTLSTISTISTPTLAIGSGQSGDNHSASHRTTIIAVVVSIVTILLLLLLFIMLRHRRSRIKDTAHYEDVRPYFLRPATHEVSSKRQVSTTEKVPKGIINSDATRRQNNTPDAPTNDDSTEESQLHSHPTKLEIWSKIFIQESL